MFLGVLLSQISVICSVLAVRENVNVCPKLRQTPKIERRPQRINSFLGTDKR